MIKMMVDNDVPTYSYVLNTTINALNYPFWTRVPHNIEYFFLTGSPFMDPDFFPEDKRVQRNQWNEDDRRMSEFLMKTLANFARYGFVCLFFFFFDMKPPRHQSAINSLSIILATSPLFIRWISRHCICMAIVVLITTLAQLFTPLVNTR